MSLALSNLNCCMPLLQAKCCVHPLPVHLIEGGSGDGGGGGSLRQQLDAAAAEAAGRGIPLRGLLVTNPNNPLGTIYRDDSLLEMLLWCLDNKVHYIRWVGLFLHSCLEVFAYIFFIACLLCMPMPCASGGVWCLC
jgi:hypothetical protein